MEGILKGKMTTDKGQRTTEQWNQYIKDTTVIPKWPMGLKDWKKYIKGISDLMSDHDEIPDAIYAGSMGKILNRYARVTRIYRARAVSSEAYRPSQQSAASVR